MKITIEKLESMIAVLNHLNDSSYGLDRLGGFGIAIVTERGIQLTGRMTKNETHGYIQGAIDFSYRPQ